ncbi:hypothetical protein SMKC031_26620 [Serratia marcescens]|nr:hypothetical protein SMKC031_26620 [Serratia marcescens]
MFAVQYWIIDNSKHFFGHIGDLCLSLYKCV